MEIKVIGGWEKGDKRLVVGVIEQDGEVWRIREVIFDKANPQWSDYFIYLEDVIQRKDEQTYNSIEEARQSLKRRQVMLSI